MTFSQSEIAIGEWASYLPYNTGLHLTQSEEQIIYGTSSSIFTIDKADFSTQFLSKIEGLSETGIQHIQYDSFNAQLIIAYQNSVIDIISEDEIFTIFDIRDTDFIQGDKRIYDIYVQNNKYMYLATGFGVVQYDLERREFGFTLDAAQKVSSINGNLDNLIIAAEEGVFVLDLDVITPNFFGAWDKVVEGLPANYVSSNVLATASTIYVATDRAVYSSSDFVNFEEIYSYPQDGYDVEFIKEIPEGWMLGFKNSEFNSRVMIFDEGDVPIQQIDNCMNRLLDAEIDEQGRIFFADEWEGIRYKNELGGACPEKLTFNSPNSEEGTDIDIKDGVVYVASGGVSETFANLFGRKGIYILEEGQWQNINEVNTPFIKNEEIIQAFKVEPHPDEDKVYIGSMWAGLVEYDRENDSYKLFNATNSSLREPVGDNPERVKISGLAFDEGNNLWISNFDAAEPLSVYTAEGNWHSFSTPGSNRLIDLVVDDSGYIWAVVGGNSGGVVILDPGQSIADPTDSPAPILKNNSNSEIPSNLVNSIAKDLDGGIWVGTAAGVVLFECGGGLFENECNGNKPKVLQDSIAAFLLATEDVLSIAVDGANRKWFGTRNGIFVQSPNGEVQIAQYNEENSPLFDNTVKALAFNGETGEMFISTNKGLQSFRTETTSARVTHANKVYAFPNPVRPEYTGEIAIKGLARDAEVKITDIDGQLVYQTRALGGQALWDGRDNTGREVSGGVYLVFSSSVDAFRDPNTYVTKILVVR
ncbi:MAG: hypothetical protein HKN09_07755 [Saprospiraceae bacterium]|nr:hypothetical protein [Saprospiraceae bacterium]